MTRLLVSGLFAVHGGTRRAGCVSHPVQVEVVALP
jgi:hypothetical protein